MKLLVCGGRSYNDKATLWAWLGTFHTSVEGPIDVLIHGAARGADSLAAQWAHNHRGRDGSPDVMILQYPALWSKYGNAAGYIRNQQMLDEGRPDLVVAFPGGRGTASMVKLARAAGVRVVEVKE